MALIPANGGGGGSDNITVGVEQKIGTITINGTTYNRYRKLINGGTITYNSSNQYPINHGISSIVGVLKCNITTKSSTAWQVIPSVSGSGTSTNTVSFWVSATQVVLASGGHLQEGNTALVDMEYYK